MHRQFYKNHSENRISYKKLQEKTPLGVAMSHMVFHHSNCIHMLANTGKPKSENISSLIAELPTHPLQPKHTVFAGNASTLSSWSTVTGSFPKHFMLHKITQ